MTTGITLGIEEKQYATERGRSAVTAIKGLNARVSPNEFCVLFGPSGCGKSTLLNIIAGIDHGFSGSVRFDGGAIGTISGAGTAASARS